MKPRKISTQLALYSILVLLALNLISAFFMGIATARRMNQKQDAYLEQIADGAQQQVEQFMQKYLAITETLTRNGQFRNVVMTQGAISASPDFQGLVKTMQETMQAYPDILGVGFGSLSENYMYDQNGVWYDIQLSDRPYYQPVVDSQQTYLTEPYVDAITQQMCVSVVAPVLTDNGMEGLLIVDVQLESLSTFLAERSFGESGRLILLSKDHTIMGYEDHTLIGKDFAETGAEGDLLQELDNPTGELVSYRHNGVKKLALVLQMEDTGWMLLCGMSKAEYNAQTVQVVLVLMSLLLSSTLLVALVLRTIIVRKLRPFSQINQGLREMSQGNLKISIPYQGEDEVGEMAESMRSCVRSLSDYVQEIDEVMECLASGDLTAQMRLNYKGDFHHIHQSIEAFIHKLTELVRGIYQASEQVSAGSVQVADGAQALAQGATEQAAAIQELGASITDLSQMVRSNAQLAEEADQGAARVHEEIRESGRKMDHSLELMSEIRNSSNEISRIIKTIEDIAFQTNILALNAAVEAARAGEAGKGFAVVASEVRNLATKTAKASQETTLLIQKSLDSVENGTASMEETARFMEGVVEASQEITVTFQHISQASSTQARTINQVTQGIDQISSVVHTNSATAEESAAASEELSGQAELLKSMLSQFQLSQEQRNEPPVEQEHQKHEESQIYALSVGNFPSDDSKY